MNDPIFVAVTGTGAALARRLQQTIRPASLHGRVERVREADGFFSETTAHLRHLFTAGNPIIAMMSAGIVIRALAPVLGQKQGDPPVLALAEDGSAVVPLLGGHQGANDLARRIADALGTQAAVTTAGDVTLGLALDKPPAGWRLEDPGPAKGMTAALLAGEGVRLVDDGGYGDWLQAGALTFVKDAARTLVISDQATTPEGDLIYRPPSLMVGVGCERGTAPEEVIALVTETLVRADLSQKAIAGIFSIDVKMDEAAVHAAADHFEVPARFFTAERLEAETPRLATPSDLVFAEVGCHGVAEGAALAAAGTSSALFIPKQKSKRATCAVARHPAPLPLSLPGIPRGRVTVVGTGPGTAAWRPPASARAVAEADELVGYGLYLDLLGPAAENKPHHESQLGEEEARVRKALSLAAEGKRVALICSGDPGVYALATLVFEVLDRADEPQWKRQDIIVEPGISAMQAAAARIGAPIGHDFCAISLSDLLTDWVAIETRLKGAALGDFVIAFYNPVSPRRRWQLDRAKEILLAHRPPDTPVILARNLGREGETVRVTTLAHLSVDEVDMLTLVLVGSSNSTCVEVGGETRVYTPRGYAKKAPETLAKVSGT